MIAVKYGSQRQFCQTLGKADDWLSRIVRGWKDPTPAEMRLIAEKLDVEPDAIDKLFTKRGKSG